MWNFNFDLKPKIGFAEYFCDKEADGARGGGRYGR